MNRFQVLPIAVALVVSSQAGWAQDLSRYRAYVLESSLESVLAASGARAPEAKTLHERPAKIQELEWRAPYGTTRDDVADPVRGIDGISETDGLEITSRNLGNGFEHGAMIAQDGRNVMPTENQNYKYVSWTAIAEALKLEMR